MTQMFIFHIDLTIRVAMVAIMAKNGLNAHPSLSSNNEEKNDK